MSSQAAAAGCGPGHDSVIADHGSYLIVRNNPDVAERIARENSLSSLLRPPSC